MVRESGWGVPGGVGSAMSDVYFSEYPFSLSFKVLDKYYLTPLEKRSMTEYVVFFGRHAVLNLLAIYLVNVYLTQHVLHQDGTYFIQIGHLDLHSLYNHFGVLSFHSILYFSNEYHMVKEENTK